MSPSGEAAKDPGEFPAGISGGAAPVPTQRGVLVRLTVHPPGRAAIPAGLLLLETQSNRLHIRTVMPWPSTLPREDREVLTAIADELQERASVEPGDRLLGELEDTFSHLLQVSDRETVLLRNPERDLDRLFALHVGQPEDRAAAAKPEVIPFRTHLPFYPMRIAAGLFDGDAEVEAAGWVTVPEGLRPDERYFVAQITGRSMEPRIADGSYCVFRMNPQGSREGKLVLAQKFGSSETGGAFAIKRYHSEKAPQRPADSGAGGEYAGDFGGAEDLDSGEWRHARVRLISLNPSYPSWDLVEGECRILAELVRILSDDEIPEEWR